MVRNNELVPRRGIQLINFEFSEELNFHFIFNVLKSKSLSLCPHDCIIACTSFRSSFVPPRFTAD